MSYTAAEWRTLEPLARQAEQQALAHPERRDLFLCHVWDDRTGAATELCGLWCPRRDGLVQRGRRGLGKCLREIDRGLKNSRSASC